MYVFYLFMYLSNNSRTEKVFLLRVSRTKRSSENRKQFFDDRLVRETRSKNTISVLLLFELALPLGIEHSLGQPGTSLFYMYLSIYLSIYLRRAH